MTPRKILEEVLNIMQTNILVDVADIKPILKSMDIEIKYKELNGNKAYTNSEEVNTIYFGNQFKKDEKVEMDTLIHEIGHILYFRKKMWDKKLKSEKEQITKYNENDMERFAENFNLSFL